MTIVAKICGLSTPETVEAAVSGGAGFLGFVFFRRSPRYVEPAAAGRLTAAVPPGVRRVGLVVDAGDAEIAGIVAEAGIDTLQLHGKETPKRVAEVSKRFGLPVIKAITVGRAEDVAAAGAYAGAAHWLLFDAQPPAGAQRPGGNAAPFDWSLLKGYAGALPWLLAGGLDVRNLETAVRISRAKMVDVSSGIEDRPGVKSVDKIRAFLATAASM